MRRVKLRIVPRTIARQDTEGWKKSEKFQGGVAVCYRRLRTDKSEIYEPRLWFYKSEWERFISGIQNGDLDKIVDCITQNEVFRLIDTKLNQVEQQLTAISLSGAELLAMIHEIKSGNWNNPPGRFSKPESV